MISASCLFLMASGFFFDLVPACVPEMQFLDMVTPQNFVGLSILISEIVLGKSRSIS